MKPALMLLIFFTCLAFSGTAFGQDLEPIRKSLPSRHTGAFLRITPEGNIQLFSVGVAAYDGTISNRERLRLEKDAARSARTELVRFMKENLSSVEKCKEAVQETSKATDSNGKIEKSSSAVSVEEVVSEINRSSSSLIRGIVTIHSIDQNPKTGDSLKFW